VTLATISRDWVPVLFISRPLALFILGRQEKKCAVQWQLCLGKETTAWQAVNQSHSAQLAGKDGGRQEGDVRRKTPEKTLIESRRREWKEGAQWGEMPLVKQWRSKKSQGEGRKTSPSTD